MKVNVSKITFTLKLLGRLQKYFDNCNDDYHCLNIDSFVSRDSILADSKERKYFKIIVY